MRITISITVSDAPESEVLTLDVPADMSVGDLKALVESETSHPKAAQSVFHNGMMLSDESQTMEQQRIEDGEMLGLHVRDLRPQPPTSTVSGSRIMGAPGQRGPDPESIRLQVLGDPRAREEVRRKHPDLADAVDDSARFRSLFFDLQRRELEAERKRQHEIAVLNDDPFNPEAQAKIEELIRQEAVMENLQNALEHNPEVFGRVSMLYIDVEVNGHKVKAFVDSGASTTVMSPSCAEACGIMRLVDKRFAGIAMGVGTAKILGRVHTAQIRIANVFLDCAFTVMEGKSVELLLGLDMLKRHQASIDLKEGMLRMQGVEVPFLSEADIPKMDEQAMFDEPMVEGPGGTRVGARTGAVHHAPPAEQQTPHSQQASRPPGRIPAPGAAPRPAAAPATSAPPSQPAQTPARPAGQQTQSSGPPSAPAGQQTQYPQASIDQLQHLGFSRDEAIAALDATGGNLDYAAGLLFSER